MNFGIFLTWRIKLWPRGAKEKGGGAGIFGTCSMEREDFLFPTPNAGGPVGLMAGIKLGGVAAVGGSILGYSGAKVISQHRELRLGS
jgi:hypothetical protein